jgi:hypothetical protein
MEKYKPSVNKSYISNTKLGDEYEDDTEDEYTEDEYTEDEYTEDEYTEDEYTEDEDTEVEYSMSTKYIDEEDDEAKYYWLHQVEDYIEQDPTWKGYDHELLRLHPDNLKKFLEKQQKIGIFKPRNLSHVEWMKIKYIKRDGDQIKEQQQLLALLERSEHQSAYPQTQDQGCQEPADKQECQEQADLGLIKQ